MATESLSRTSEPTRFRLGHQFGEILRSRQVLANLTRKERRVKYKSTVLGVAWSMLNPLMYLVVFFLVFTFILQGNIQDFSVYLLSGLLGYTLFSTGLQGATLSVVDNSSLVTKVAFPREILPLSAVGASLFNFFWQLLVLVVFMTATGYSFWGPNLLLLPAALAVLLLLISALGLATSALNVRYRDMRHLVELSLVAWFWLTPIVYAPSLALGELGQGSLAARVYLANPLTNVTLAFQRALYGYRLTKGPNPEPVLPDPGLWWYWYRLGLIAAVSLVLLYLAWRAFFRYSGDFAEEL